jgi:hypothetical protein
MRVLIEKRLLDKSSVSTSVYFDDTYFDMLEVRTQLRIFQPTIAHQCRHCWVHISVISIVQFWTECRLETSAYLDK